MRWVKYALLTLVVLTFGYVALASHAYLKWRRGVDGTTARAQRCYTGHGRYEDWHTKVVFPYRSPVSQSVWADRVRKIHKGQSTIEVYKIVGEPDFVEAGVSKEGDRFIGCVWKYEVQLKEDFVNYKRNSWIEIFFDDADGKVIDFVPVNIEGIPNRPFPRPTE